MNPVDQRRSGKARSDLPSVGPLSGLVADLLGGDGWEEAYPRQLEERTLPLLDAVAAPLDDDDLQLALYLCYELHYRSFAGVHPAWEWNPALLGARALMETAFFGALEEEIAPEPVDPGEVGDALFRLEASGEQPQLQRHLASDAGLDEYREFVAHCSLFRLKEADPHSWAIPRLSGGAKAALLRVLGGDYLDSGPGRMHAGLFARAMRSLGLDDRENAYLSQVPGSTLAPMNLMTGLGLHRSRRGAIVGHLAMLNITAAQRDRRHGECLRRFGLEGAAADRGAEEAEADGVRENAAAYEVVEELLRQEPELAEDVVFGARALIFLEERFASPLLTSWRDGKSALRGALVVSAGRDLA